MSSHTRPTGCLRTRTRAAALLIIASLVTTCHGSTTPARDIVLPESGHPFLACTADELARVRQAYRGTGDARDIVAAYVERAKRFVNEPVNFPPRGGQHNQWYQCDQCEIALRTIDATHHKCPRCEKVYSGAPYDDVIFSRQHGRNLQQMLTAAWAYAIAGDERFAQYAAGVLLGYAERYTQYPYHSASRETQSSWGRKAGGHLYEQTLTEASALARSIAPAYDLIAGSKSLSPAQHEKIRTGLLLPMLQNLYRNKAGKSNWQTWHNAAMIWGGALVNDPAWIRKAIDDPDNGFYRQMDISVSKEGMWYENSWGYHFYTLRALVEMAETSRRLGLDLWSHERFARMFTLPIQYTMARGMLPRFGDDVNSSVNRLGALYEPAYHAYRDPQMLALLDDEPGFQSILLGRDTAVRAEIPQLKSVAFEGAGHAILRGSGAGRLTAALTFGPYGGFHGHYDKLSVVFFGHDQELGVDPGRARSQAYRLPIHRNWYKATLSHNTVLVDGKSQAPAAGALDLFEQASDYTAVAARCDEAYAGVQHKRWLVMTADYLLVFDELHADADHRFEWLYHNRGDEILCDVAQEHIDPRDRFDGGEYLQNARRGTASETIRLRFEDANVETYLTVAGQEGTSVLVADGVGASVTDRIPMTAIGREGRHVCFAAVVEPVRKGEEAQVTHLRCKEQGRSVAIDVELGNQAHRIQIAPDDISVVLSP